MSDTEQEAVPIYKTRRWRRLIGVGVVLCVLAIFVLLTLWAARPRWYTFVSKPIPVPEWTNLKIGRSIIGRPGKPATAFPALAVTVRVPVGWECRQQVDDATIVNVSTTNILIRRTQPTGFLRWWVEHVLHTDARQNQGGFYSIGMHLDFSQF